MNFQEQEQFYNMMTNLRRSRAASTNREDRVITEVINGVITSRPLNRVTDLQFNETTQKESEPEIIDLQEYAKQSKAGSVPRQGINKLREIHNFMFIRRY